MSSSSSVQGIQWVSGSKDTIVTWSSDLRLFTVQVVPREHTVNGLSAISGRQDLSEEFVINCPAMKSELQYRLVQVPSYMKCVRVCPSTDARSLPGNDVIVAVGQANGKISLMSFMGGFDSGHVIREYGPKSGKVINDLAWNPVLPQHLAAGFEKSRSEPAILVFDTTRDGQSAVGKESVKGASASPFSSSKTPTINQTLEMAPSETCHSLAWFPNNPERLVSGMSQKSLKIYDIRLNDISSSGNKAQAQNVTRAVHGVCVDPFNNHRVASHHDDNVVIWDLRNFDKPIWTKQQTGKVRSTAWSPTRSGLLCSLLENSTDTLVLHDIQSWAAMSEDGEPAVTQRLVNVLPMEYPDPRTPLDEEDHGASRNLVTSFVWHPDEENCIVATRKDGRLAECHAMERIAPSWSSQHFLMWPQNGILRSYDKDCQLFDEIDDISLLMKNRAAKGSFTKKHNLQDDDQVPDAIKSAFVWLSGCAKQMEDLAFRNKFQKQMTHPGIRTALWLDRGTGLALKSDITYKDWTFGLTGDLGEARSQRPKRVFKNDAREKALKLCGWGSDEADLKTFTTSLEEKNEYARAAAVAVFCLEIRVALQVLERAPKEQNLAFVAMALSGFSEETSGALWREQVKNMVDKLDNAYLRTMFTFLLLSSMPPKDQEDYGAITNETDLLATDRVAFCCLHLPDGKLSDFVNQHWITARKSGDLGSIFLCGASTLEAVELIQCYIDITGDVQSAAWIAISFMSEDLLKTNASVDSWIVSYRNLLLAWGLWEAKADFDFECQEMGASRKPVQQVYISCNYCGKSISRHSNGLPEVFKLAKAAGTLDQKKASIAQATHTSKRTSRFQACPQCRKPLPRCAICLKNMGSHSGYMLGASAHLPTENNPNGTKITPFSYFFIWCQTCRHGGHADHMHDWFESHKVCPVSGCNCYCDGLDESDDDEEDPEDIMDIINRKLKEHGVDKNGDGDDDQVPPRPLRPEGLSKLNELRL